MLVLAVSAAVVLGLATAPAAAVAEQNPQVSGLGTSDVAAGKATPAPPVKLDQPGAELRGDCSPAALEAAAAKVKPLGKELGAAYEGMKALSCATERKLSDEAAGARKEALAKARAQAGGDARAQDYIQPPQWCFDHAYDGWWGTRTQMCSIRGWHLDLIIYQTGQPPRIVGQAEWNEINYSYTSDIIDRWAHQIRVSKYWSKDLGRGAATIFGYSYCNGDCKQDTDTGIRPTNFTEGTNNDGEAYNESTRGEPGGIGYNEGFWDYWINYSGFPPVDPDDVDLPTVRCDNAIGDNNNNSGDPSLTGNAVVGAGCVFLGILPVMIYSKSGLYPTLAAHIEAAQLSGLPGAYPNGAVLNRITDATKKRQNGDKACPSGWTRPTNKSCDEYPFRSTTQGASTQQPQGTARTFAPPNQPWCEMQAVWGVPTGVTGPTGWSSCMIDATHNRNGGAALGAFYSSNRVLDGDAYKVWIQP